MLKAQISPFTSPHAVSLRLHSCLSTKHIAVSLSLHLQPTGTTSAEQAEIQQLLAEENVEVLTEEDRDRLTQLDSLTGVPRGDDVLLFALPMCAPYQVCSGTCLLQRAQLYRQVATKALGFALPQVNVNCLCE